MNAGAAEAIDGQAANRAVACRQAQAVAGSAGICAVEFDEGCAGETGLGTAINHHGDGNGGQCVSQGDGLYPEARDLKHNCAKPVRSIGIQDGLLQDPGPLALVFETMLVAAVPCGAASAARSAVTTNAESCLLTRGNGARCSSVIIAVLIVCMLSCPLDEANI